MAIENPAGFSVAAKTPTSISLQWTPPLNGELRGYKLAYYESDFAPQRCDLGSTVSMATLGLQTGFTVMGLKAKTLYSFRICAVGVQDSESSGLILTAKTNELPPEELQSLFLVQPSLSSPEIQVSWSAPAGISNVRLSYLRGTVNPPANCNEGNSRNLSENNFKITDQTAGDWLVVRACSLNNNTPPDMSVGITRTIYIHSPAPSAVANLQIPIKDTTSARLEWQASTGSVSNYVIAYSEGGYPVSCEAGTIRRTTSTQYAIQDLRPYTKIYGIVCAENRDSLPLLSPGVNFEVTTNALPIPPVANLRCPSYPSYNVTWNQTNPDGYYVSVSSTSAPAASCITNPQIYTRNAYQAIPPFGSYVVKVCAYMASNPNTISDVRQVTCSN